MSKNINYTRYYVLYLKDITDIRVLGYHFLTPQVAGKAIKKAFPPKERKHCKIVSGKDIKLLYPKTYAKAVIDGGLWRYEYPKHAITSQARKSLRTLLRRRLRRMGIFVKNVKPSKSLNSKAVNGVRVTNTQKIAHTPNSESRIIVNTSWKPNCYYLLKTSIDFKITAIQINIVTGNVKNVKKTVNKNDIITPFSKSEFLKICRKRGHNLRDLLGEKLYLKYWINNSDLKSPKGT